MNTIDLPHKIVELLERLNSPKRLIKHLQIVYSTGSELLFLIKKQWPTLDLNEELILFGAGTHDIGKAEIKKELYERGKEHEATGKRILKEHGFTEVESRFALTHGNFEENEVNLEDLLVSLADKIWKGNRVVLLEEKVGHELAELLEVDYWDVYAKLDAIIEEVAFRADERLLWQNQD